MTRDNKLLGAIGVGIDRRRFLRVAVTAVGSLLAAVSSPRGALAQTNGCDLVLPDSGDCPDCEISWSWLAADLDKCVYVRCLECCSGDGPADARTICSAVMDTGSCLPSRFDCTCNEDLPVKWQGFEVLPGSEEACHDAPRAQVIVRPPSVPPNAVISFACGSCVVWQRSAHDRLSALINMPPLRMWIRRGCWQECGYLPWW